MGGGGLPVLGSRLSVVGCQSSGIRIGPAAAEHRGKVPEHVSSAAEQAPNASEHRRNVSLQVRTD